LSRKAWCRRACQRLRGRTETTGSALVTDIVPGRQCAVVPLGPRTAFKIGPAPWSLPLDAHVALWFRSSDRPWPAPEMGGGVAVLQGGAVKNPRRPSAPAWHNRTCRYIVTQLYANWGIAARGLIFE
jgi:hypothetical protein